MNRRSFFKTITGLVGGVVAAFVPGETKVFGACKEKPMTATEILNRRREANERRSSTEFVCHTRCNCPEQQIHEYGERILVTCPNHPPYYINEDGTKESVMYYPRAIDIKERMS
jgi:hypothetical protein